jgi:hypothetical protein
MIVQRGPARPTYVLTRPRRVSPLAPSAGPFIIAVGQVLETNFAQAIAWAPKRRLIGQVTETNLAQALSRLKTRVVGQVVETNLAQAISVSPLRRLVTQVVETNLAQAITALLAGAGAFLQTVRQDLAIRIRHGR